MNIAGIRVVSVNTGRLQSLAVGGTEVPTGHFKTPVAGPVAVGTEGLAGDEIGNLEFHGGPDQAVYLYSVEDADHWARHLGRDVPAGFFGENVTITRWWPEPRVGDRMRSGSLVLELTFPRLPCTKLAARAGDPTFLAAFVAGGRPGYYARVLSAAPIAAGDVFTVTPALATHPSMAELYAMWHKKPWDRALMQRALAAPIASRAREAFTQALETAAGS
jgi:MOSC domain-containing protein YiiM